MHRDEILAAWERDAREILRARELTSEELLDNVPAVLDQILERGEVRAAATEHAAHRLSKGFDLSAVIGEYTLLRRHLLRGCRDEVESIGEAVDRAIQVSVEYYTNAHQRVLRAVDRVSELALTGSGSIEVMLRGFLEVAREAAAVDTVSVLLREGDRLRVRAAIGFLRDVGPDFFVPVGEGFAGTIAATRKPLLLRDASTDTLLRNVVIKASQVHALYGAPLIVGDEVIGVVHMGSKRAADFADEDKVLFHALANRLVAVLAHALFQARDRATLIATRVFATASSLDEAARTLLAELGETFRWTCGAYWKVDERTETMQVATTWSRDETRCPMFMSATGGAVFRRGEGLPGAAWSTGVAQWRRDVAVDPTFPRAAIAEAEGLHSAVAFPMNLGDKVVGVIELFTDEIRSITEESVHTTRVISEQLGEFVRRLATQDALRVSEEQKAAIIDGALDAIVGMDAAGVVTGWNPAAESTFGWSRDEVLGREMADVIIPERLRESHRRGLSRYLSTRQALMIDRRLEVPALCKSGHEIFVELVIVADASTTPRFTGFLRDITARKRAEVADAFLTETARILVSTLDEQRIIDDLAALVVERVADMCIIDVLSERGPPLLAVAHRNPEHAAEVRELRVRWPFGDGRIDQLTGGVPGVLVPTVTDAFLESVSYHPEYLARVRALGLRSMLFVQLAARGRVFGTLTLAMTDASGRTFREEDRALIEEFARRASLAIDNARLYATEQQAVRVREDVLAIVSHDLKNPLGAIAVSSSALLRRDPADERTRMQLETIQRSARRMDRLIRDLLDLASIEAGRLAIEPRPHAAHALAREAYELHAALAQEKGIELSLDVRCDDTQVQCDRDRTLQVFANLLGNAIKFCEATDKITLGCAAIPGAISFSVTDTGPGIPEDEQPRLFDPYWSARRHAKKGTGLGLFISKGIVEAQGGQIHISSVPGHTRFTFTVPRATS